MGERHGDGAGGRRREHPGGPLSGPESGTADPAPALEALLAAALRESTPDAEAEKRAVAAFRAARDAGAHRARTRRRDDWRTRAQRRTGRSVRATLALGLASLTLGGVAVAAIGSAGTSHHGHAGGRPSSPPPSASVGLSHGTFTAGTRPPGASAAPDRPDTAQDTEAHCRAYEAVKGRGKALDATAWRRLIAAAGGEGNVAAYCAEQLDEARARGLPGSDKNEDKAAESGKGQENPEKTDKGNETDEAGKAKKKGN